MIEQGQTYSFRLGLYSSLVSTTLKMALYDGNADLSLQNATVYTTDNEVTGTGYTAGGQDLVNVTVNQSAEGIVYVSFDDVVWDSASFTARGAMIYDSGNSNASVALLNFGADKVVSGATFTVSMPPNDANNAVIRNIYN